MRGQDSTSDSNRQEVANTGQSLSIIRANPIIPCYINVHATRILFDLDVFSGRRTRQGE